MTAGTRWRTLLVLLAVVATVVSGCASLPTSSAPQAIGTVARGPVAEELPEPAPGREPSLLVRDFVKASTDPTDRHAGARQFLTPEAADRWNDGAIAIVVDKIDVLEESRTDDSIEYTIRANRVGQLDTGGQYRAEQGSFETRLTLVLRDGQWRIDELPSGVVMDRTQFLGAYQRRSLYFVDPTGTTLVPDQRWIATSQDRMADTLITLLQAGPRLSLEPAVRNVVNGLTTAQAITKADGRPTGVGVGPGGVRVDLRGASPLDSATRTLLAAQIVWTLARAEVSGPYVLLADGAPLDPEFPDGWTTADLAEFDPSAVAGADVGLHALRNGSLVRVGANAVTPVPGFFGTVDTMRSIALSTDGTLVAAVSDTGRAAPQPPDALLIGSYGGSAFPVAEGGTITRPTWGPDRDAVWAVIDGSAVRRAVRDPATGQVSLTDVESSEIAELGGQITELRLSRDGVRAALIVDGAVYVAVVVRRADGSYSLREPEAVAAGLASAALSLDWSTGDTVVVARAATDIPIVQVAVDGSRLDGLPSRNLTAPVVSVDATPSTTYVADSRAVFEIDDSDPASDRYWREVPGLTGAKAVPVLPG
ncbi:Sporulation and spore germination [Rhodococcoides kroppenstedtii]|uniref:Lipoprotein LpqB n=1 Tax=Rhodococcoides kroppenstedtii TaxID=293050 RepID=A0A1I0ST92_9NOCA|nr:MtrAB system accessory lipoprotein LpqB [Rhodococcus kroppenstedtii]SFA42617.1 Sporulation and spore germination [Rhodococcus kroppenstedtii]